VSPGVTELLPLSSYKPQIGRLEDIHFNPWFSINVEYMYWQTTYGRAFVMGRSDWECTFVGLADEQFALFLLPVW